MTGFIVFALTSPTSTPPIERKRCPRCGQFMKMLSWIDDPVFVDDWYWECSLDGPITIYSHEWDRARRRKQVTRR